MADTGFHEVGFQYNLYAKMRPCPFSSTLGKNFLPSLSVHFLIEIVAATEAVFLVSFWPVREGSI